MQTNGIFTKQNQSKKIRRINLSGTFEIQTNNSILITRSDIDVNKKKKKLFKFSCFIRS